MPAGKRKLRRMPSSAGVAPARKVARRSRPGKPAIHPNGLVNMLSNGGTSAMRQGALIQMQRDLGNRKARQMVPVPVAPAGKAPAIQRDTLDQSLTGVGAPIAGLKRGDGLKYGTYDKRDRVSILQVQLNEKMMANIRVDGKFGPRTEEVLGEFQESVDLAPSPVVDPVTADLLMSESEPEPIPGPQGETVHPNFVSSGESLKSASINIFMTSILLST